MDNLQDYLVGPSTAVLTQVGQFVAYIFFFILILLLGLIVSNIIKLAVIKILKLLPLDKFADKIELHKMLEKGGISLKLSELIGEICYWVALLVTFVVALNGVGLTIAAELLQKVVLYVPNVIAAIFVLIVGMFASVVLKNIVKTSASNMGISQVNFFSKLVEAVVIIFSVVIAIDQLQIGARIVETTWMIVLGSLGLGFALAFGLGCKDLVGKAVAGFVDKMKK